MIGGVSVTVEGTRVVRLVTTPPMAAKILPGPVLLLIGSAAGLLAGDRVRVEIDLAPGAQLTIRTTAATIAHPCLAGGDTALDVSCQVGAGARLVWLPEPTIACGGCRHSGRALVTLGAGATACWLENVTLGRCGEEPGPFSQRLDVSLAGRPLLREGLRVGPGAAGWDGPAVVGPYRHIAAVHSWGRRVDIDGPHFLQLAGPGTTARFVARRADELARQVGAVLPLFTDTTAATPCTPKEILHV